MSPNVIQGGNAFAWAALCAGSSLCSLMKDGKGSRALPLCACLHQDVGALLYISSPKNLPTY